MQSTSQYHHSHASSPSPLPQVQRSQRTKVKIRNLKNLASHLPLTCRCDPLPQTISIERNWNKKKNGWFCGYFGFCCFDEAKATTSFHKFCPSGVKFLKAREDIQEKSWNPGNETSSEALGHTGSPKAQPVNSLPCRTILGRYQYSITSVKICFSSTCSCWDVGHNASP